MCSKKLLWLVPLFATAACGSASMNKDSNSRVADTTAAAAAASPSSYSAAPALTVPERKIKRTADFHCKVQNVFSSVTTLEQLVKANGGIVQESNIENSGTETKTSYYKPDSLRQTQIYTTTALLTLRVPSQRLDSLINAIPGLTTFIESRRLRQSDVTYQYLANDLKNEANETHATATAMKLARKSKDAIDAGQYEADRKEQQIGRKIENLQLLDDVSYATITVAFSQPEQVFVQTIVNPEHITSLPFNTQCRAAINTGLELVSAILVALISVWPLLLLSVAGLVIYLRIRQRKIATAVKPA
jgi:hypothetical protein